MSLKVISLCVGDGLLGMDRKKGLENEKGEKEFVQKFRKNNLRK